MNIKYREQIFDYLPDNIEGAELGVFEGSFSDIIIQSSKFKKLYLVDVFDGIVYSGDKNGENGKYVDMNNMFFSLVETYKNKKEIAIIKSYSDQWLNTLIDDSLDFVYIDADHSYEGVSKDLALSFEKIKHEGIIAGHDYNTNWFPGVVKAVDEFVAAHNLTIHFTSDDKLASFFIMNKK
jgi:hypothetical protein